MQVLLILLVYLVCLVESQFLITRHDNQRSRDKRQAAEVQEEEFEVEGSGFTGRYDPLTNEPCFDCECQNGSGACMHKKVLDKKR